ncbi:hypothetical protein CLAFUW4_04429 [Fulvia fulva]|uniref:Uncharacterized protein n=1 Tax=Passalora fulva TaxID=5499 RepID=A0A9Q8P779_PASFU|nr:uncharacterized protein CLAFUR5_04392 [Fulvia fulva]KAK4626717.1 hypothetical protein CLAFUR4_04415 [Fulvia fulva]KAK4627774.1 hypothetical protein CLAFUR0_04417 [Fulvia fulva]UJO15778.1 hypothetical protein CLAFUR5_04392 [Fulvia fulva]WPV13515.1 hypothetical protein CLAFUW4_04429 [Fulvia fulva]WPV28163.1 hypothetical protein CLAFUW7_04419 [Fulvia fulva]
MLPQPGRYASLVYNGVAAWRSFPIYHTQINQPVDTQFIQLLEQANLQGREVILLIHGMAGHSCASNVYGRMRGRFPNLPVRIIYALRASFVQHANGAHNPPNPHRAFLLNITPLSPRSLHYSQMINISMLVDNFLQLNQNPIMRRIIDWHLEGYNVRTGGLMHALVVLVLFTRGVRRNAVV